jgi:hypothetical protein
VSNHNNGRYNDHTGAHVAHVPLLKFYDRDQTKTKSDPTDHSNSDESVNVRQPNVKDYGYTYHRYHFPTQLILLALLFVAFNFSPCSCGNNYPLHYSVTDEKLSISPNDVARHINQEFGLIAVNTNDDVACGVTDRSVSSDSSGIVLGDNAPLLAMLGVDWEMLASLRYSPEYYSLKPAGTEMILHPTATYNQQKSMRCKRPGPTLDGYRCSKLDDTLLNKCNPADNDIDDQDSNRSSSFCPLRRFTSKYLHLHTHYTMTSTMKGLLLTDDIISIIIHQKMLQIQPKYFPLIFWLMVIGLTFSVISGMSYDDDIHERDSQLSQSRTNSQSARAHDDEIEYTDSDSSLSYHTASDDHENYGNYLIVDTASESELSVNGSMTNHDIKGSPTYMAHVVLNQSSFLPFVYQFEGVPSLGLNLMEDYRSPTQETQ